jgi:hypothetical protein
MGETVRPPTAGTRLDRWSGGCWIVAGVLLLAGVLHPNIFETTLADAALHSALWVPIHAVGIVVVVLTLVGLTGLYARRADRLGRLGAAGFALAVPGLVMTACAACAEAVLLPVLAREDPKVFDWDGPVTTSWAVRLTTGLALLWPVGLTLLGIALTRSGVASAAAGLTLAGSSVGFVVFNGPLLPVLGALSTLALTVGYVLVGASLWTAAGGIRPSGAPTGPATVRGTRVRGRLHRDRGREPTNHPGRGATRT